MSGSRRESTHRRALLAASGRPRVRRAAASGRLRLNPHVEYAARLRRELRMDNTPVRRAQTTPLRPVRALHQPAKNAPLALVVAGAAEAWPGAQADLLGSARELAADHAIGLVVLGELSCEPESDGVDRLIMPDGTPDMDEAAQARWLAALVRAWQPAHLLFADSAGSGDLLRRVAALLGETPAVDITVAERGRITALIDGGRRQFVGPAPRLLGLTRAACAAYDGELRFTATLVEADIPLPAAAADRGFRDAGLLPAAARDLSLTEAELVISAGAGVEDWATFEAVADRLSAAVGASRVVCDAGALPRSRQVGASGSIIEARGYLALGISGAPQHLQGIKSCRHVVAVNTDAQAPIMERADLAVVGDAQAILRALQRRLDGENA